MDIVAATSAASIPAIIIVTGAGMLSGLADEAIDDYFDDGKHSLLDYIVSTTVGGLFNLIGYGMAGNSNALKNTIKDARSFAPKVARKGFTHFLEKKHSNSPLKT